MEAVGQSTFNRRYDPSQMLMAEVGWSIELADSGNFMVFGNGDWTWQEDSLTYYTSSILKNLRIDDLGNVLNEYQFWDSATANYPGISNCSQQLANGKFIAGGSNFQQDLTIAPIIYLFNEQGALDTLYIFSIQGEEWIGRQARQTVDGGYVVVGDGYDGFTNGEGFVLKADSLGAELWRISYGGVGHDLLRQVDTMGTGFYVGGQDRTDPSNYQLWAIRLDSIGAVLWETIWGSPYNDGAANLVTLQNGNPLVASTMRYTSNLGPTRFYMAELDSADGSIIWEQEYGQIAGGHSLSVAKEVEFSTGLIAVGSGSFNSHLQGVLLRTNAQGDSIWMRQYVYADSVWNEGKGALGDVISTPDNGFIAVGVALPSSNNPNDPPMYSQDIWVVKVDSMGCLLPGCHIVTGIENQVTNYKDALKIWPNPSASGGQVQLTWELPKAARSKSTELPLVSTTGQLMFSQPIDLAQESIQLDVHDLKPGMYFIHLVQEGTWISGAKLLCLPK